MLSQEDKHHNEYKFINWTWLNSLNMMDVMKDTTSTYWVQACMFQKRDCINQWRMLLTMYGYCLQDRVCFNPLKSLVVRANESYRDSFKVNTTEFRRRSVI